MPDAPIDPDDDATLIYTSGSTGHPKGVLSTHRNAIHAVLSWELDWAVRAHRGIYVAPEVEHQEGMLLAIPLFHVAGSHAALLSALRPQRKMVCMYKWDVQQGMELIERERLTLFTATPAISGDLVNAAKTTDRDLSSLLVMGGGGAPRAPEQVRAIDRLSKIIIPHTGWGMTEINAIGTSNGGADYLARPSSPGQCSAVLDMRVVDESGRECRSGERGELQVRGTTLFREYWNRPEATAESFDDEWFRTGDMAIIDDEGFLFIVDRIKELIKYKGFQVPPAELEGLLLTHEAVADAAVIGIPDDEAGEIPKAFVTLKPGSEATAEEIQSFVAGQVATFKQVRLLEFIDVIPKSASGKILRRELRDR